MSDNILNITNEDALVEQIARLVVEKLLARQKKLLLVYTGSNIAFSEGLEQLAKLKEQGFVFDVVVSRSGAQILDINEIKSKLSPSNIWVDSVTQPYSKLVESYGAVVVPALTVKSVASIVTCMPFSPATEIITSALMRNVKVIAAINGCCPDNEERAKRGYSMAEPLKQHLRNNMELLKSFGATLTIAQNLNSKVTKATNIFQSDKSDKKASNAPSKKAVAGYKGKVLSGNYIRMCLPNSEIKVSKGTLITQLAADEARIRNITILIEDM